MKASSVMTLSSKGHLGLLGRLSYRRLTQGSIQAAGSVYLNRMRVRGVESAPLPAHLMGQQLLCKEGPCEKQGMFL